MGLLLEVAAPEMKSWRVPVKFRDIATWGKRRMRLWGCAREAEPGGSVKGIGIDRWKWLSLVLTGENGPHGNQVGPGSSDEDQLKAQQKELAG